MSIHQVAPLGMWIISTSRRHLPRGHVWVSNCPYVVPMSPMAPEHEVMFSEVGSASGPRVLLVHGIGVSGRYFAPLVRALSSTHHVVTPDLPGFGTSGRPRPALTITEQAIALETALQLKDRTGLILVGHSMGSQVVTELAVRNPTLARGLVLIGPVTEPPNRSVLRQVWRLTRDLPREPAPVNAVVLRDYIRGGIRSFAGSLPHMLEYPLADRLSAVCVPPLVLIRGEHDPIAGPAFLQSLATASSGDARVVEIPGAGHVGWQPDPTWWRSYVGAPGNDPASAPSGPTRSQRVSRPAVAAAAA